MQSFPRLYTTQLFEVELDTMETVNESRQRKRTGIVHHRVSRGVRNKRATSDQEMNDLNVRG